MKDDSNKFTFSIERSYQEFQGSKLLIHTKDYFSNGQIRLLILISALVLLLSIVLISRSLSLNHASAQAAKIQLAKTTQDTCPVILPSVESTINPAKANAALETKKKNLAFENFLPQKSQSQEAPRKKLIEIPTELNSELETLAETYQTKLGMNKQDAKILLSSISTKKSPNNPCREWKLDGDALKRCEASRFEEAGHFAINAKLIPCKQKHPNASMSELKQCYMSKTH